MTRLKLVFATLAVSLGSSALDAEWTIDNPIEGETIDRNQTIGGSGMALGGDPTRAVHFQRWQSQNPRGWYSENSGTAVRQIEGETGYPFWAHELPPPEGETWTPSPLNQHQLPIADHRYILMEGPGVVAEVPNLKVI